MRQREVNGMSLGELMRLDIEERRQEEAARAAGATADALDGSGEAADGQTLTSEAPRQARAGVGGNGATP